MYTLSLSLALGLGFGSVVPQANGVAGVLAFFEMCTGLRREVPRHDLLERSTHLVALSFKSELVG